MARSQVVDDAGGLQMWRVAANRLTSSRGQPTECGRQTWGLGEGLTHRRKPVGSVTQGFGWALVNTVMNIWVL
jgi:hypothetical protein